MTSASVSKITIVVTARVIFLPDLHCARTLSPKTGTLGLYCFQAHSDRSIGIHLLSSLQKPNPSVIRILTPLPDKQTYKVINYWRKLCNESYLIFALGYIFGEGGFGVTLFFIKSIRQRTTNMRISEMPSLPDDLLVP